MSIADLTAHFKRQGINIATLTRKQVIEAGYDGGESISLVISCIKRQYRNEQHPQPRRKAAPKRSRKAADTGRKPRSQRNSAATAFHSEMTATAQLLDRANDNGDEVETEAVYNPLRLFDTSPDELYPTFVVIRPETPGDVLEDLAANLPDSGYERIGPEHDVQAPW